MHKLRGLSRVGRVVLALAVGGAVFGIATAVQASIPDSNAIVHSCYNTSLAHGSPIGAMRAIDTGKVGGVCASWEGAVDLATPQYVQNVVTSTVNQTEIMGTALFNALPAGNWVIQWTCGGWVETNPTVAPDPPTFSNATANAFTVRASTNVEMQTTSLPGTTERIWFNISAAQNVNSQITCVDPRVYGETYPVAGPRPKPTVTLTKT
jgi:hypothetical protein